MEPFLYDLTNNLYHKVMDDMPQAVQDRDIASAFILGAAGSYAFTKTLQWISRNIMDGMIPDFDEKLLPILERVCQVGVIAIPTLYAIIDPEGARTILMQHPTYSAGMTGAITGGIICAQQDINKKPKKQKLEEKINKSVSYPPELKD